YPSHCYTLPGCTQYTRGSSIRFTMMTMMYEANLSDILQATHLARPPLRAHLVSKQKR
ncbi:Hypothetical protein FKW44_013153, partial [Caligus rogercresseyi]